MSKSSGNALERIIRSRSSLVSRFSLARLEWDVSVVVAILGERVQLPVLEPDLHLPGTKPGDFACKPFSVSSIRMGLSRELAHEEPSLVVGEPVYCGQLQGSLSLFILIHT